MTSILYDHYFPDKLFEHRYTIVPETAMVTSHSITYKALDVTPMEETL